MSETDKTLERQILFARYKITYTATETIVAIIEAADAHQAMERCKLLTRLRALRPVEMEGFLAVDVHPDDADLPAPYFSDVCCSIHESRRFTSH